MEPADANQRAVGRPRTATDGDAHLEAELVRYPDGPDRVTVHPSGVDGVALMSTWLTADADAFVSLGAVR